MKLLKKIMTVFGETAGVEEISVFGSLSEGVTEYSTDPDEIQKLATYSTGWFDAVFGNRSPAIEDRMALDYLMTYQLSYLFQQGIPEYNPLTEYHIDSYVKVGKIIYRSLIDTNVGNPVSNTLAWDDLLRSSKKASSFKNYPTTKVVAAVGAASGVTSALVAEIKLVGKAVEIGHVSLDKFFTYGDTGAWTSVTLPSISGGALGLISGNDIVIAYQAGSTAFPPFNYNDDGTGVWKVPANAANLFAIRSGAYGNGFFIMPEAASRVYVVDEATPGLYSVVNTSGVTNRVYTGTVYNSSATRFIIAGTEDFGNVTLLIEYSDDNGSTWSTVDLSSLGLPTDFTLGTIKMSQGNGMILVYGIDDGGDTFILRSVNDGLAWTIVAGSGTLALEINQLTYCDGFFIATSFTGTTAMISTDGENWESFMFDATSALGPKGFAYSSKHNRIFSVRDGEVDMSLIV